MRIQLPAHPSSASMARRAAIDACGGIDVDLDAVALCTSELLTNALLHGRPPIELELSADRQRGVIYIRVRDGGADPAEERHPISSETMSGRGLTIVDALATRWGAEASPQGHIAWFELRATPAEGSAGGSAGPASSSL